MLKADGAVDTFKALAEPMLAEVNPQQIAGYLGMGQMALAAQMGNLADKPKVMDAFKQA